MRGVPCETQPPGGEFVLGFPRKGSLCQGKLQPGLSQLSQSRRLTGTTATYRGTRREHGSRPDPELQELPKAGASPLKPWCCCWAAINGGVLLLPRTSGAGFSPAFPLLRCSRWRLDAL